MKAPQPIGEDIAKHLAAAYKACERGAPIVKRLHMCSRCEVNADMAYQRGDLVPHVNEAETWVHNGMRYWAGTCSQCARIERAQRQAAHPAKPSQSSSLGPPEGRQWQSWKEPAE